MRGQSGRRPRFHIVRSLGVGGTAHVYEAVDWRLQRRVALKFISVTPSGAPADDALLQEAAALANLNHPNVRRLYDVARHDGRPCLVMEYLEGQDLKSYAANTTVHREMIARMAIHIAEGLMAAHRRGVVHNDIKPRNLFLTRNNVVKILDFGSAVFLRPHGCAIREARGPVIGTASYISPERLAGRPLTPQSDLFSLGAVLYELAAGRSPFVGRSTAETLLNVIERDPVPLFSAVLDSDDGLAGIILKLLAKRVDRRYASAARLRQALLRLATCVEACPSTASSPHLPESCGFHA